MKRIFSKTAETPLDKVRIVGLKDIKMNPEEAENFYRILEENVGKLKNAVNNEFDLKIELKQHSKTGNKHKWSVKMQIEFPGRMISSEEHAWDLEEAVHKSFSKLKRRAQTYFNSNVRGQDQKRKPKKRV